jgi:hypothetical protein
MRFSLLLTLLPVVCSHLIKCISIYGLETPLKNFVCSWKNDVSFYITELQKLGFNTLRVPFSFQYVRENDFSRMDHFFTEALIRNMSIMADLHRVWSDHQGPDPFENGVTVSDFVNCWKTICNRYQHFPNFIAINSYNEYTGSDPNFVSKYSSDLFTEIEKDFPNRYSYWVTGTNWGSNLRGINLSSLPFYDRVGYSIHKYSWHQGGEKHWDETIPLEIEPEKLIVGEFSWTSDPSQQEWARQFIAYLKRRNIQHSCYWTIAHSGDTGNLYEDDCQTLKWDNYNLLKTLWDEKIKYLRQ